MIHMKSKNMSAAHVFGALRVNSSVWQKGISSVGDNVSKIQDLDKLSILMQT